MPRSTKITPVVEHINGVATASIVLDLRGKFDPFNARSLAADITEAARRAQDDALLARIDALDKEFPVGAVVRFMNGELGDVVPARTWVGSVRAGAVYAYNDTVHQLYVTVRSRASSNKEGVGICPEYLTIVPPSDPRIVKVREQFPVGTRVCFVTHGGDVWFAKVSDKDPFYSQLAEQVLVYVDLERPDCGTICRYADDKLVVVPS